MRIYISGPFTAPTTEGIRANVQQAMNIGAQLILKGHQPYIPHLTYYLDAYLLHQGISVLWDKWIEIDLAWLKVSEGFFLIAHSPGADIELGHAKLLGLPIYYNLADVPDERDKRA